VFFTDEDYRVYLSIMQKQCRHWDVDVWAYCLMPNHVHLLAVPATEGALAGAIGEAHRRYTWRVNRREDWKGHLWQGRFASFPADEVHAMVAARYIELNPLHAGLCAAPWDYEWSSARAHVEIRDDLLVRVQPLLARAGQPWPDFLAAGLTEEEIAAIEQHVKSGYPLAGDEFIRSLEHKLGRTLRAQRRGPKNGRRSYFGV
jgi:putative transposase